MKRNGGGWDVILGQIQEELTKLSSRMDLQVQSVDALHETVVKMQNQIADLKIHSKASAAGINALGMLFADFAGRVRDGFGDHELRISALEGSH